MSSLVNSFRRYSFRKWGLKVFVALCFLCLLIPNRSLFQEAKNAAIVRAENRRITAFPAFKPMTKNFYTEIEKFYQDRLYKRDKLIKVWCRLNFYLGIIVKDNLFMGKNKWLFDKGAAINRLADKDIKIDKLKKIQDYCNNNGADFVFIAPPYKNAIYADYIPEDIKAAYKPFIVFDNEVIKACKDKGVNYISLYDALIEARKKNIKPIYLADDHHWSYEGAAVAADEVLKYIKAKNPSFNYNGLGLDGTYVRAFKEHSQISSLGLAKNGVTNVWQAPWSKEFTYEVYGVDQYSGKETQFSKGKYPVSNAYLWGRIVNGEGIVINKATKNKFRVLFLNDSYASYMTTYMSQHISNMVHTHFRDHAGKKKNTNLKYLINKYKPDLVILEISSPTFFNSAKDTVFSNIVWK